MKNEKSHKTSNLTLTFICFISHDLHCTIKVAHYQGRAILFHIAMTSIVPVQANNLNSRRSTSNCCTLNVHLHLLESNTNTRWTSERVTLTEPLSMNILKAYHKITLPIINMNFSIPQAEQQQSRVRGPLNSSQSNSFQFFSPNTITIHRANYDST